MNKYYWLLIFFAGLNSTFGNILLKKSQEKYSFIQSLYSFEFILGCVFYLINVLLFAYALKYIEVTKAYPVLSAIAFFSLTILSYYSLGEKLALINYLGIAFILIGITLIIIK